MLPTQRASNSTSEPLGSLVPLPATVPGFSSAHEVENPSPEMPRLYQPWPLLLVSPAATVSPDEYAAIANHGFGFALQVTGVT